MLKLFSIVCLVVSILVVGCAKSTQKSSPYWNRAGTEHFSYAELTKDQDACRTEAIERTTAKGKSPSLQAARRDEIIQCMEDKGWVRRDAGSASSSR
jgi:hypothetical protein